MLKIRGRAILRTYTYSPITHSKFMLKKVVPFAGPHSRRVSSITYNFPATMITQPYAPATIVRKRKNGKQVTLPASWMRCGTSKGLFIDRQYLPLSLNDWSSWLIAAMGSKGEDVRQLDGIGGATSTTSKAAIVSRSTKPGIDVEYTFAQVAVGKEVVDFSGNCGNIASGVGPYAVEQGLVESAPGQTQVRSLLLCSSHSNTPVRLTSKSSIQTPIQSLWKQCKLMKMATIKKPETTTSLASLVVVAKSRSRSAIPPVP